MAALSSQELLPLTLGTTVAGRYRLDSLLGAGTFGWVVAATNVTNGTRAAIKVLRPERAESSTAVARFVRRELEVLKRVHRSSPVVQVVRVLEEEVIEEGALRMLPLEYIDGPTLAEVIAHERILDQHEARRVLRALALGVAAIHAAEGVHRDIKPENIRLRANGEPVLLDLGIAKALWTTNKMTATNETPMTPLYASPEQLSGGEVGPPSDVYSLALVAYEMLAGAVPLSGRTFTEILAARLTHTAPDVRSFGRSVSASVSGALHACLARDPAARPTAAALADVLGGDTNVVGAPSSSVGIDSTLQAPPRSQPAMSSPAETARGLQSTLAAPTSAARPQSRSRPGVPAGRRVWLLSIALGGLVIASMASVGIWSIVHRPVEQRNPESTVPRESSSFISTPLSPATTASTTTPPPASSVSATLESVGLHPGEALRAKLTSSKKLFVVVVSEEESGAATILAPGSAAGDIELVPDRVTPFPPSTSQVPLVVALAPGRAATRETLVVLGFESLDALSAWLPSGVRGRRATVLDSTNWKELAKKARDNGAVEARAEYEITRR